jgi:hypothetical protein
MVQGGGSIFGISRESVRVTVRSGETARADLELPSDGAKVSVRVTQAGAPVGAAQVVLVAGEIRPGNVEQLQEIASTGIDGTLKVDMITQTTPNATLAFTEVSPGAYTVCAVWLPGDIMDPEVREQLQRDPNVLPLACEMFTLAASDREITVNLDVPKQVKQPVQRGK